MRACRAVLMMTFLVAALYGRVGGAEMDERAVDFYLKGLFLEARYDLTHAYSFYSYAERYAPESARIKLRLATVTLNLGDLESARRYAGHLIEAGEYEAEAQMIFAEADYRGGEYRAALKRLLALERRDDVSRFAVLRLLAQVYIELDRIGDARRALEEAADIFSGDLLVQYRLGLLYMDAGETGKAIDAFEKAIEINPDLAGAHTALASLLRQEGRLDEARREYREVLRLEPTNGNAFREYIDLVIESGSFDEGIAFLEPLYREGKLEEGGELTLGNLYYRAERGEDARDVFKRILDARGERPFLLRALADIEMDLGNLSTSYGYLRRLMRIEPDSFSSYVGLMMLGGDLAGRASTPAEEIHLAAEEVDGYFRDAARVMDPRSAEDNYLLGLLLRRRGNGEEAARYLLEAERLRPLDRKTAVELASLFEDRGDFDEALKRIVPLYERSPDDADLKNFYGYLLAEKGVELELAETLLEEALALKPDNGYYLDSLGWIKYRRKEYGAALEVLRRAIEIVTDDAVIWSHLGDTYRECGMLGEAAEAYRKSLTFDPENTSVKEKAIEVERGVVPPEK